MTEPDLVCNFTATCPAPAGSGHLPGCPSMTVPRLAADMEHLEPAPMFPSPRMDYELRGPDDWPQGVAGGIAEPGRDAEPVWFPPYFVLGFACGVVVAGLAVFVGFMLAAVV